MATSKPPYGLHVPADDDLADVPDDFDQLVTNITTALNTKLDKADKAAATPADVPANYQRKILVQTTIPTSGADFKSGDIIFVIPPT